jgi:hypothetical protein
MSNRAHFSSFSDMPTGLRRYLFSQTFGDGEAKLREAYKLSEDQSQKLGDLVMDIVFNDKTLPDGIAEMKGVLVPNPVAESNWKLFVEDFLKEELWPIRELFGDELSKVMADMNIVAAGWPQGRVLLKPLSYSGAASELMSRLNLALLGPSARERLRTLVVGRVKGSLVDAQIKESLMRQEDFGGLGLDAAGADATVAALSELLDSVEILSEEKYADWLAEQAHAVSAAAKAVEAEDAADVAAAAAKVGAPAASLAGAVARGALDEAVDRAYAAVPQKPAGEYLERRMRNAISTRLRGVRSSSDLMGLFQRESKVGGLDFDKAMAEAAVKAIDVVYEETHAGIAEDERRKLEDQIAAQRQKVDARKRQEAEDHAKWYEERVKARQGEEAKRQDVAEQMRRAFGVAAAPAVGVATIPMPASPAAAKGAVVERQRFGDLVPAAAVAVPIPATALAAAVPASASPFGPMAQVAPVVPGSTQATVQPMARPEVKLSQATVQVVQAAAQSPRPRMDDIRTVQPAPASRADAAGGPRLVGLLDELGHLSIAGFRRLGRTPEEAAAQVQHKIDLLGQESFAKRLDAAQAWMSSPVQQAYVALVAEAFRGGKPVAQLAEERRASGGDALSPAEIAAIVNLNAKQHF